jgi:hypothetical protein
MYLMYADESGDSGLMGSPTRYFVLSGLVVHELRWRDCLDELIRFRQVMRAKFGLKLREEIHSRSLINRPGSLIRIPRYNRLTILRHFADALAAIPDINVINIAVDKQGKPANYDVFDLAWKALIQRMENTLRWQNFPGPKNADERGALFCDGGDKRITTMIRRMRGYNPVPNQQWFRPGYRNLTLLYIVEDPNIRDSAHSYFIQAVDATAFLLHQYLVPNGYMRRVSGQNYFKRLQPILCLKASSTDPLGIVRL